MYSRSSRATSPPSARPPRRAHQARRADRRARPATWLPPLGISAAATAAVSILRWAAASLPPLPNPSVPCCASTSCASTSCAMASSGLSRSARRRRGPRTPAASATCSCPGCAVLPERRTHARTSAMAASRATSTQTTLPMAALPLATVQPAAAAAATTAGTHGGCSPATTLFFNARSVRPRPARCSPGCSAPRTSTRARPPTRRPPAARRGLGQEPEEPEECSAPAALPLLMPDTDRMVRDDASSAVTAGIARHLAYPPESIPRLSLRVGPLHDSVGLPLATLDAAVDTTPLSAHWSMAFCMTPGHLPRRCPFAAESPCRVMFMGL